MTDFPPYSAQSAAQVLEEEGFLVYPHLFEGQEFARLRELWQEPAAANDG